MTQQPKNRKGSVLYIPFHKRKPKAAHYIRVSTHHQIDRDSLPFQRQELENYCRFVLGIDDFVVFEDAGYSAKNTDRPKFQEMMDRIRQGEFTHLLVWKLDRISRNLRDFTEFWDEIREYEVTFVSKMEQFDTSSAMGEAMLRIILVFAELERKLTAERVYSLMLSRAEKALWNGAPVALGYDWDENNQTIKINPDEAALVQLIYDQYEKLQSALSVAQLLEESGKKTKRGGHWTSKGVIDILRNPSYIGIYRWNYRESGRGNLKPADEVIMVEDALPTIILRDQWNRVQFLLDSNYKGSRDQQRRSDYVHTLSCLIKCAYCGKNYIANRSSTVHKNGYRPTFYRCSTYVHNRQCNNKTIASHKIEPFVLEYIRAYVQASRAKEDFQTELLKAFNREEIEYIDIPEMDFGYYPLMGSMSEMATAKQHSNITDQVETLKKKKQKIERALSRLDDAYFFSDDTNVISKSEYLVKKASFQQELQKIDSKISSLPVESSLSTGLDMDLLSRFLLLQNLFSVGSIRDSLLTLDKHVVQDFLQKTISYIEVADKKVTKIAFHSPAGDVIHQFIYKNTAVNH